MKIRNPLRNLKISYLSYKHTFEMLFGLKDDESPIGKSMRQFMLSNPLSLPSNLAELFLIIPVANPFLISYVETTAELIGKNLNSNVKVDDYISLTRFHSTNGFDRYACDWCSVVNGLIELYMESMREQSASDILSTKNIFFTLCYGLGNIMRLLPDTSMYNYPMATTQDVSNFVVSHRIKLNQENIAENVDLVKHLKRVLSFRNLVAQIESRWCPFGYMTDLRYTRNYQGTDLESATRSLRKFGRIKCVDCAKNLNELHGTPNPLPSDFADLVKRLKEDIER